MEGARTPQSAGTASQSADGRWPAGAARRASIRARALLRAGSNRLFKTRLAPDPAAPALVLSPHLDDAVLNCWSVLSGTDDVCVVNVFAGIPSRRPPEYWDLACGARDARVHAHERIAEDRQALALAGRRPVNLPFVDWQYRQDDVPPSFSAIDRALTGEMEAVSVVYAPASLGHSHPDHVLIRSFALQLLRGGIPIRLYADLPYCARDGWPSWVSGRAGEAGVDVDASWRETLAAIEPLGATQTPEVRRLLSADATRKLEALQRYKTQFSALDQAFPGVLSDPEVYGYEVAWTLRPPGEEASSRR